MTCEQELGRDAAKATGNQQGRPLKESSREKNPLVATGLSLCSLTNNSRFHLQLAPVIWDLLDARIDPLQSPIGIKALFFDKLSEPPLAF